MTQSWSKERSVQKWRKRSECRCAYNSKGTLIMCITWVYSPPAVRTGPGTDLPSFQSPYYLFFAFTLVQLNNCLGWGGRTENLGRFHYVCLEQVDEVMQEKLLEVKQAVDGEIGPVGKKTGKGDKVRAASWESWGAVWVPCPGTVVVSANLRYKYQNIPLKHLLNVKAGAFENLFTCGYFQGLLH